MVTRLDTAADVLNLREVARRAGEQSGSPASIADAHHLWLKMRAAAEARVLARFDDVAADARPVLAHVNHGRWVGDCPGQHCEKCGGRCGAAMALLEGEPFVCACCWNADLDGKPRPVEWPSKKAMREIEAALTVRSSKQHRNWLPIESVERLKHETRAILDLERRASDALAERERGPS